MTTVTILKTRPSTPIGRQKQRHDTDREEHATAQERRRAPSDAATAVSHFHTHSVPLDMEDIRRDWDKPISEAGLAAKTSVVVRVGALTWVPEPEASACVR